MAYFYLTAVIFLTLTCLNKFIRMEPVNVALNRPVSAKFTCGIFGMERYNTILDVEKSYADRNGATCQDLRPNGDPDAVKTPTHGAIKMVDGSLTTWWQSTSRFKRYHKGTELGEQNKLLEVLINLDLQQEFLAEQIIFQLGDALSPQKISIRKSLDGVTFIPWMYAVSSAPDCSTFFTTTFNDLPAHENGTVCLGYNADGLAPADDFILDISKIPVVLKEWTRVRYLEIKFYDMLFAFPFNQLAHTFNHYAIRELSVMAECPCNGQQQDCQPSPTTGQYECVCGGNTKGRYCESCRAMFNQYQFQIGVPCRECNCFNHATSCFYRPSVEANKESLDKDGNRKGGGVCLDCQHNTAGINCDKCVSLYYRPLGVSQSEDKACVPCGCSAAGSTINPDTGIVECVMNDDVPRTDGKVPGECFCKTNTQGIKCDTCKRGFYKLDQNYDEGCIDCACFTAGTIGASEICVGNETGQCPCKNNVQGRACDECKDNFYGLSGDNTQGCVLCGCDVGGASNHKCDKGTGQCTCRSSNIKGRTCDSMDPEFYYPSAHAIYDEFEDSFGLLRWKSDKQYSGYSGKGYAVPEEQDSLNVLLNTPASSQLSGDFVLAIVYQSPVGETANGVVNITSKSTDGSPPVSIILPACPSKWCLINSGQENLFKLSPGPNLFTVTVTSGKLLLDKMVAVPNEYLKTDILLGSQLPAGCDFLQKTLPESPTDITTCKNALFSVTMFYWQTALPCDCDVIGSTSPICDVHGGQCTCRTGVIGRKCDACAADYYGFSSIGCTPCECDSLTSSCDPVTGQCQCPENTFGRKCEFCLPGSWGWNKLQGCKDCGCHPDGAAFPQCNDTTGICTCKPGVVGDKCDECQDNFYNLQSLGCSPCACDVGGSNSLVCNKTTGQCDCKANTDGRQCNQCLQGTFGLDDSNPKGCLECICMGVSTQCTSSNLKFSIELFALSPLSSSNLKLATSDGNEFSSQITIETGENSLTSTLVFSYEAGQPPVYWKMPNILVTSLLNLYGTDISVTVSYINVDGTALPNLSAIILTTDGKKLTSSIGSVNQGFDSPVKVSVRENSWTLEGNAAPLQRTDFLKILARGSSMLIPATFSSGKHTSKLLRLEFNVQSDVGTVNPLIELCQCNSSYTGSSCESCADGYKRSTSDSTEYFGECFPCECNSHSSLCDQDTGECLGCEHNTVGKSCEECTLGFYGNATKGTASDCLQCPCFQPRVVNASCHEEEVNGVKSVKCDYCQDGYVGQLCHECNTGYYGNSEQQGGSCSPCQCNGNADSCDGITGVCQNCQFNTVGNNCEKCAETFFGNASLQNCQECSCTPDTSTAGTCDATSGQCPCVVGVGGRTCDECLDDYWGFNENSFVGCRACNCNAEGSVSTQCDGATGKCTCKPDTEGDLCDSCSPNFYGLPLAACQACACNGVGTIAGTTCNVTDGQCSCQPGIGGRTCDGCLPLYVNFSSTGCEKCDQCQNALGSSVEELTVNVTAFVETAQNVYNVQNEDTRLQALTTKLQESLEQLGLSETDATSVTDIVNNITSMETALQNSFITTNNEVGNPNSVSGLLVSSSDLSSKSKVEATEQQYMLSNVTDINTQLTIFGRDLTSSLQTLVEYNSSASELAEQGKGAGTINLDLSTDISSANELLLKVQDDSAFNNVIQTITTQKSITSTQMTEVQVLKEKFDNSSVTIDKLASELNTVAFDVAITEDALDGAMTFKSQAEELLAAAQTILTNTEKGNEALVNSILSAGIAVSNTNNLYNGDARPLITGEDALPFPSGVTNYDNGKSRLELLLSSLSLLVDQVSTSVSGSETHINTLQGQYEALNNTFKNLPSIGKEANEAIRKYEMVIEDLDSSVKMADTASSLINQVQTDLSGDALQNRQTTYSVEKNNSEAMRDEMVKLDYKPEVLENKITAQKVQLEKEADSWKVVDSKVDAMNEAAQTLKEKLENNPLVDQIVAAEPKVTDAATKSKNVAMGVNGQSNVLDQKEIELETTRTQIQEIKTLDAQARVDLNDHLTALREFQTQLNSASSARDAGLASSSTISEKIARLETKLATAESLLERLRQPRTFDGGLSLQIDNPKANTATTFNSLSFTVRKASGLTDGNIFFTENQNTNDEFEVGLKSNKVFFEFYTGSNKINIQNSMEICDDCWAKVVASRLGNVGYLSVSKLPSGEVISSSSSGQSQSSTSSITLTSPLYVGSLPQDTNFIKVDNKNFEGCLVDVNFQSQAINLWSAAVSSNQEAKCCEAPPTTTVPTFQNGVLFSGFGFIVRDSQDIVLSNVETLSFEFRTYSPSGTLFLVGSADSQTLFSIGLLSGAVVLRTKDSNGDVTVKTSTAYNTGKWTKVQFQRTTNVQLSVNFVDTPGSTESLSGSVENYSNLNGRNLIFGASSDPFSVGISNEQASTSLLSKVDDSYFSGCFRNLQLKERTSSNPKALKMSENVVIQAGVKHDGCSQSVLPGVEFLTDSAYVQLSSGIDLSQLSSLEMNFITREDQGVLLYIAAGGTTRNLYVGLFGGHVIVKYQQESLGELISEGIFVSDGQQHTLKIDMTTGRVSVNIDGRVFEDSSATLSSTYLSFAANGLIHLGGVPQNTLSTSSYISIKSFMGGISSFIVNGNPVVWKQSSFEKSNEVSLSGVTSSSLGLSKDACAPSSPPELLPRNLGISLDGTAPISWSMNAGNGNEVTTYFNTKFVLDIDFATYKADGILLYVADKLLNPTTYYFIYLENGLIKLTMKSSLGIERSVQLAEKYNSGQRFMLKSTRENDFVTLQIGSTDYANTKADELVTSSMNIPLSVQVYVAGIGVYEIDPSPLPASFKSDSNKINFAGAFFSVKIAANEETRNLLFTSLDEQKYPAVPARFTYGVSLNGVSSYLGLGTLASSSETTIDMKISTTTESALLFALYEGPLYFVVDFSKNQMRLHLSATFNGVLNPLTLTIFTLPGSAVFCDAKLHSLRFQFSSNKITVSVDGTSQVSTIPVSHAVKPFVAATFVVGGLPGGSPTFIDVITTRMKGCVENVVLTTTVGTTSFDPTQSASSSEGLEYGCPV